MLDAIAEIQAFTDGMNFDNFQHDLRTIRAVEMNLIIIGEAAIAIPDEVQECFPNIPWHLIRGMRNRLVHAYFAVDKQVMWDTAQRDLPVLAAVLKTL
jgi:uncharacterized protein with HEPN domain